MTDNADVNTIYFVRLKHNFIVVLPDDHILHISHHKNRGILKRCMKIQNTISQKIM